ncbi:MAG TPA: dihydroxy-acid dehydratase [Rhodopirellula baltica]|uniref:Dihydroxy-acid dehydratase n=2 Tax=Rhodopirellula baltica TaxID=265606 RepID=Q7UX93_RHOBA|nr:IlvD/Edd family dehydratase [Rhodopirellula baltica]CAD72115.1 Dihydroxy-acid dehydratase [Rhodopirellula baltica SH 1]HBE66311.1 dihydroxy-acid dehydratase [Rhodopirellula baltica]
MNPNPDRDPTQLRSHRWFGRDDLRSFGHRSRLKGMGFDDIDYRDRPVVAILNTWSELNTCHSHFRDRADEVRRGILQSGGFPVEVPVMSLGEMMMKPTTMLYRNLLAMEVEEVLRCHPIDAAVLMGGCDKTVPAMLMGAISADIPSLFLPAGAMLRARWKDQTLGSGSDAWKYWDQRLAGNLCDRDWNQVENCIAASAGTCMTMGTASTMACVAEAMGWTLPSAATIPAVMADHSRLAVATGRRAVEMAWEQLKPSEFFNSRSIDNGLTTSLAIGGSTNAIVHLIAIAGRLGETLTLDRFDELSRQTPVLGDLRPGGRFLMQDFFEAGGLPALLQRLRDLLNLDCKTVAGSTLGEQIAEAEVHDNEVIRTRENPVSPAGGVCLLRGNLAPSGCVIKSIAASKKLLHHRGKAVVFNNYPEMKERINDPDLEVDENSVLILRSAGPLGAPGFPEWGMLPIPKKLLQSGVTDMVRMSDARMSGTSYGTCVLHIAPESAAGGPLSLVETGDEIEINVPERSIHWHIDDDELARRKANQPGAAPEPTRGYMKLYAKHVTQADQGCDFDFLAGRSPGEEPAIH